MNIIVILCGGNSSGKTSTLKGFFDIAEDVDSPSTFVKKELDGKTVCAVSFSSPQERLNLLKEEPKFCNFMEVQRDIKERILECDKNLKGKSYALLIPFTMSTSNANRKKLNVDCIIKPIEELQQKFKVFAVYLRKTKAQNQKEKNALMAQIKAYLIKPDTTKDDCDRSAQLEKYLRQIVIKTV